MSTIDRKRQESNKQGVPRTAVFCVFSDHKPKSVCSCTRALLCICERACTAAAEALC